MLTAFFKYFSSFLKTMSHVCQNQTDDNDASRCVQRAYSDASNDKVHDAKKKKPYKKCLLRKSIHIAQHLLSELQKMIFKF